MLARVLRGGRQAVEAVPRGLRSEGEVAGRGGEVVRDGGRGAIGC